MVDGELDQHIHLDVSFIYQMMFKKLLMKIHNLHLNQHQVINSILVMM